MNVKVENLFSVSGKVIALTGAAGVIFSNVAKGLAANGAKVALLDIMGDKVRETAEKIEAEGGEAVDSSEGSEACEEG